MDWRNARMSWGGKKEGARDSAQKGEMAKINRSFLKENLRKGNSGNHFWFVGLTRHGFPPEGGAAD